MQPRYGSVALGLVLLMTASATLSAQDNKDRRVEEYECRDIMRDSGGNRDVSIAFLHGYLLGKSNTTQFNLDKSGSKLMLLSSAVYPTQRKKHWKRWLQSKNDG